jgi:hypothetical protein
LSVDQLLVDQLLVDKLTVDQLSVDQLLWSQKYSQNASVPQKYVQKSKSSDRAIPFLSMCAFVSAIEPSMVLFVETNLFIRHLNSKGNIRIAASLARNRISSSNFLTSFVRMDVVLTLFE